MAISSKSNAVSQKHDVIAKFNSNMFVMVALAVFVVVFSLFAINSLVRLSLYNNRVISEKKDALDALEENIEAAEQLERAYVAFITEPINILGGNPAGDGPKDGDNAKLVLDALPSEYDYPALSSSIEKILVDGGYQITAIGGKENPLLGQDQTEGNTTITTSKPAPTEIPYPFTVNADPVSGLRLLETLEASIRPFYVKNLVVSGGGDGIIIMNIDLQTYFQSATGIQITKKEVQ